MAKTRRTTTPHKHDGDQDQVVASDTDSPVTPTIDDTITHEVPAGSTYIVARNGKLDVKRPKYVGIPYFRDTKANVKNIADPNDICWERDYGNRDILCWANPKKDSRKDVQLIVVGKIKSAELGKPNRYDAYTIDLRVDEEGRHAFNTIWKSGKWGSTPGYNVPLSNQGVAKFSAKLRTINREAQKKNLDLLLTEHDPFPGLHNGSAMHKGNTTLKPHPAHEFTEGVTVAVEATVATYDFSNEEGDRKFGYSLALREVYWLSEDEREDEHEGNSTTPRKRRLSEDDLVSPRSFRRKNRVATFDPLLDES